MTVASPVSPPPRQPDADVDWQACRRLWCAVVLRCLRSYARSARAARIGADLVVEDLSYPWTDDFARVCDLAGVDVVELRRSLRRREVVDQLSHRMSPLANKGNWL